MGNVDVVKEIKKRKKRKSLNIVRAAAQTLDFESTGQTTGL